MTKSSRAVIAGLSGGRRIRRVGMLCGMEGLAWAKLHRPDAVICDISMPDIPGTQVAIQLKRFLSQCRILLMSAYFSKADMREFPWRQVLPFEVIAKPVDARLLLNWLNSDLA